MSRSAGANEAAAEEDGLAAGESQPLLDSTLNSWSFDLEDLRRRAHGLEPLDDWRFVEQDNRPWFLVLSHAARAVTHVTVVLGAYFFLHSVGGRSITPHCIDWMVAGHVPQYSFQRWQEYTCYFTTACFWTYPIVCPLAIVVLFWTNLLDKRLFYECLFHKVFLQQHSMSYLTSWTFWLLLLHFVCGMSCVLFKDLQEDDLLRHETVFGFFAYLSACVAFLHVLFTNWSVNRLVVPLPMFVENDLDGAMTLLKECKFIRDVDFWRYFQTAEALCEQVCLRRRMSFTMNTSEMILLILDIEEALQEDRCSIFKTGSLVDKVCLHGRGFRERHCRPYWVSRFLYFPALQDTRSKSFRQWSRTYYAFMVLMCILFGYTMVYTLNKMLLVQGAQPDWLLPLPAPHKVPGALEDAANDAPDMMREGLGKLPQVGRLVTPVKCSLVDGSGFSSEYPCTCGSATCLVNQACGAISSTCQPADEIRVEWPCKGSDIGAPVFRKKGTTKSGAPYFGNGKTYLYYDPNCDGVDATSRWIINDIKPNIEVASDLDKDATCSYMARTDSDAQSGPPSGKWKVACDKTWKTMEVKITMAKP